MTMWQQVMRWATRQDAYSDMKVDRLKEYLDGLDGLVTAPERVDHSETFLARYQLDQARRIAEMAAGMLHAPHAEVNIVTADEQITVAAVDRYQLVEPPIARTRGEGWCQNVVALSDTLAIEDGETHPLVRETDIAKSGRIKSYLGAPIVLGDNVIGALCVYDEDARSWSEDDANRLTMLADVVSSSSPA